LAVQPRARLDRAAVTMSPIAVAARPTELRLEVLVPVVTFGMSVAVLTALRECRPEISEAKHAGRGRFRPSVALARVLSAGQ
jgi:hypothetical protein